MTKTNSTALSSIVRFRVTSGALILATLLAGCGGGGSTPTDNNPPPTNNKTSRTLTITGIPAGGGITRSVGSDPFTITITVSAGTGAITYTSSDPAVATIDGATGEVTLLTVGTTTITATIAADDMFNEATISFTLTVEAASPPTPPIIPATQSAMAFHTAPLTEAIVIENTGSPLADDGCQFVDAADSTTATTDTAGLSIERTSDMQSCQITGTPQRSDQATAGTPEVVTLFIRAFNSGGSDWTTLTLTIAEPVIDLSDRAESVELTAGVSAETVTFVSTGNFVIPDDGCNISPALPAGLTLAPTSDNQSCQITGTPTETRATTTYAVTGRNGQIADSTPARLTLAVRLPAMQIQTGMNHSCLLNPTGEIWCWGSNFDGRLGTGDNFVRERPTRVGAESNWRSLSIGNSHTCAINASAELYCWGEGDFGQLGTGDNDNQDTPTRVGMRTDWHSVSVGSEHTCGIRDNGTDQTLWCWGEGGTRQLGTGDTNDQNTPMQVGENTDWHSVSGGSFHTCGIRGDGTSQTMWCWGEGDSGQLGRGDTNDQNTPMRVGENTDWRSVNAGSEYTCGIQDDGAEQTLWCWGLDGSSQLGTGGSDRIKNTPTQVGTNTDWHSVNAGFTHTCGIQDDGDAQTMWCWGFVSNGQLGTGENVELTPSQVGANTDWHSVSASLGHTCGIRDDGNDQSLWCWGDGAFGQLGIGNIGNQIVPARVDTNTTWNSVSTGTDHTCGIRTDKTLWCWGESSNGRLGTGSTSDQNTPTQVGGDTDWHSVSAGEAHTCGIRDDGTDQTLWCWGEHDNGRLGTGSTSDQSTPVIVMGGYTDWHSVSAGADHTCGIQDDDADQTLWCWGEVDNGRLGRGSGTTDLTTPMQVGGNTDWHSVSAGAVHTCGIQDDGTEQTLYCWGLGDFGLLGANIGRALTPRQVGTDTDWHSVSASEDHTCGIRKVGAEQTLWCWGRDGNGRLGNGSFATRTAPRPVPGITTASLVDTGSDHTCAISTVGSNNTLFCWGDVSNGRLGIDDAANMANTPQQTLFAIESLVTPGILADALDTTEVAFNLSGTHSWTAQTEQANDNTDAAAVTTAAENDLACITSYVEDAGTLSFYWRVSSEMDSDFLKFYLNNFESQSISGAVDWVQVDAISVLEDSELRWCYEKDGNTMTANEDSAFLDQVVFTPTPPATP